MFKNRVLIRVASLALFFATATNVQASKEPCNQSLIDRMPPETASYIYPRVPIQPFYQWENN